VSTHLLLEAAVRSLVMGAIIFVALRLMRIEQVRARRTAWLLALAGALGMPLLVSAQIGPRLLPEFATLTPRVETAALPAAQAQAQPPRAAYGEYRGPLSESHAGSTQDIPVRSGTPSIEDNADSATLGNIALSLAVFGYCVVAAVLSLRLCAGVGLALRLRNQAERLIFPFDPELDVRTSTRVASPVTIGSSVLLPGNYTAWDAATLRIVLSHERAHVRQKDFLIQALAGLHCALFWFNPFSWWLQRQLAELGEALSDCAAVEEAESRTGYAEILLAFATRARWPLTGVAMANASNLTPRIERLLNDQGFERSFAKARRLPFIAAGVVALSLFASTAMVRVHATPTDPTQPNTPVPPNPPPAPSTAVPNPPAPPATDDGATASTTSTPAANAKHHDDEEGVLVIHSGHSNTMFDAGDQLPSRDGDYIYFQHNGKHYLVQDPQIIAKAQALLEPMKALREKQRLLGNQQSMLGVQQRMLGSQQRSIRLAETPEFKQQMAELQKRLKEIDLPRLTAQIDRQALAEVQAHLGEIQAHVAELQMQFGSQQGQFGEQMSALGEQQSKLGEQQSLLGEQQRKIAEEARRELKPLIEQAIREGKGKQLSD
jgi:beta-lactamase regulating signal transducer with metallopeptidase domain